MSHSPKHVRFLWTRPGALGAFVLAFILGACSQVIPVAPHFSGTDMTAYFWTGTPYDPTFLITSYTSSNSTPDQVNVHVSGDSLQLTDGVAPHGIAHFSVSPQTVTLDYIEPNNVLAIPGSATLSDQIGVTYVQQQLHIRALLYLRGGRLLAGTLNAGLWYSDDNGKNWTHSVGGEASTISSIAQLVYASTIYGVSHDTIYYSNDTGKTFKGIVDPSAPHSLVVAMSDTAVIAGVSPTYGPNVVRIDPYHQSVVPFSPQFSLYSTDSILSLISVYGNTLIAGTYQKSNTGNHIFRCRIGEPTWSPAPLSNGANVYALAYGKEVVFGGTSNTGIVVSHDFGLTWKSRKSMVSRSSNTNCMIWAYSPQIGYAGTTTGEVLAFDAADTDVVTLKSQLYSPIMALACSPTGQLLAATEDSLFDVTTGTPGYIASISTLPVIHRGMLTMLSAGVNGLQTGATWSAGYVLDSSRTKSLPLTARVTDHLDSLVLPLSISKNPLKDVFVIRYAYETSSGIVSTALPYWMIYYARSIGPVVIELLQNNPSTTNPVVLNKAVYDPPY
jgi:hypothetical protein